MRKAHFEEAQSKINRKLRVRNLCCNIFVVFLKCTLEKGLGGFQQDLRASNMLINVEVEAIESEVHLNYPVDTREEEKVRIKSRNQVSRSRRHQEKS